MKIGFSMLRTVCVCMGLIFPVAAGAATDIAAGSSHIITGTETWTVTGSPYLLKGNVSVQSGGILTIDAGVTVQFDASATLSIEYNSALIARGESGKEILFTAATDSNYAAKIYFATGSVGASYDGSGNYQSGSILERVIVENIGAVTGNNVGGAVQITSAYPFIHQSTFRNNHSPAIGADGVGSVTGDVLKIVGNTFTGQAHALNGGAIAILGGNSRLINPVAHVIFSDNIVRDNMINGNAGGLWLQGIDQLEVLRNVIENNLGVYDGGGALISGGSATISSNTVRNNKATVGGGLLVSQMSATTISDNVVTGNNASFETGGYRGGMGGGIYVEAGTYWIERNIVAANSALRHSGGIDLHEMAAGTLDATVRNNVIAESNASGAPSAISAWEGGGEIYSNAIVENTYRAPVYLTSQGFKLHSNTIALNSLDVVGVPSSAVLVGCPGYVGAEVACPADGPVINGAFIFDNNILGNRTKLDLGWEEKDPSKILALGSNWWGSNVDPLTTGSRLLSNGGTINVTSWADALISTNPIAPPSGVAATVQGDSAIHVTWEPVDGSFGYRVHWGNSKGSPYFEHVTDTIIPAGTTSYDITGLSGGNYYVAVTALKSAYVAANDDAATPVNDNMTRGDESWYGHAPKSSIASSDLTVSISAYSLAGEKSNGQIIATDVIHHRIVVTNKGPSDALDGYSVTDVIPAGLRVATTSLPAVCEAMGSDVMCSGLELALDASVTFDIPLQVVDSSVTSLVIFTNTVEVTPNGADPELSNNQATLKLRVNTNDLAVSWLNPAASVPAGTNTTYTVKTRNNGRAPAQAADLNIIVPTDITVISIPAGCDLAINTVRCSLGAVSANSEVLSSVTVSAAITGQKTLNAEVTSSDASADMDTSNNVAAATTIFSNNVDSGTTGSGSGSSGGALGIQWSIVLLVLLVLRRYVVFRAVATAH